MTDENTQEFLDRFTRAVDELKSKKLEIQLRGINALEQIANVASDRYYSTIMKTLTAYVRKNAPRLPEKSSLSPSASSADRNEATIQAIITVLGRRKKAGKEDDVILDLS